MKYTLISRDNFDPYRNRLFVMCDCGEEILEFVQYATTAENDDDWNEDDFHIMFHGWYSRKISKWADFDFADKKAFEDFLNHFFDSTTLMNPTKPLRLYSKYYGCSGSNTYLEVTKDKTCNIFSICLYKDRKKKGEKPIWEVILHRKEASSMIKELSAWIAN